MSYPYLPSNFTVPVPATGPPAKRPGTVTVAAWLLFGAAVCFGLLMVTFAYELTHYGAWADAAAAKLHTNPATVATAKSDNTSGQTVSLVLSALLVLVLVASGVMALRRMRTGQVMAFVAAAVTVLCCGVAVVGGFATGDSESAFDQATLDAAPGWPDALTVLAVLALPLSIVAVILLLTPSSRRFFSRTPPAPAGYMYLPASGPGAPVYPPYSGYPPPQQWMAPTYPDQPYPPLPGQSAPPTVPGGGPSDGTTAPSADAPHPDPTPPSGMPPSATAPTDPGDPA